MKIIINELALELYNGAKIKDAVLAYFKQQGKELPKNFPQVEDRFGNQVAHDGSLQEGNRLIIKSTPGGSFLKSVLCLLLLANLWYIAPLQAKDNPAPPASQQITILAINDMHANIDYFPQFAAIIDSFRSLYPDLLLLSAGDNQTGNPINDQYPEKGLPIIELMNAVGFNLSVVGNHEFDSQPAGFRNLQQKARFPFICANMKAPDSLGYQIEPYKLFTLKNGLKVAVLGLLHINPNGIPDTHPDNVKGILFRSPVETAKDYMHLKDQSDLFVILSHYGFENDVMLAMTLPEGVDLIIGGHSHSRVEKKLFFNNIIITQAENKLKYATLIKVEVLADGSLQRDMELINIRAFGKKEAKIQAMVDRYNDNPKLNAVLATSTDEFPTYEALGYLMADALRWGAKSDIALVNPGGVRIDYLPKGDFRILDVFRLDPFGNEMVLFKLSGKEMVALMKAAYPIDEKKPLYVAGIRTRLRADASGALSEVQLFDENNQPLDLEQTYTVAMNSYMAVSYQYPHHDPGQSLFITTSDNMIEYLKALGQIRSYREEKRVSME